jgi:hypothetical protein
MGLRDGIISSIRNYDITVVNKTQEHMNVRIFRLLLELEFCVYK